MILQTQESRIVPEETDIPWFEDEVWRIHYQFLQLCISLDERIMDPPYIYMFRLPWSSLYLRLNQEENAVSLLNSGKYSSTLDKQKQKQTNKNKNREFSFYY